MSLSSPSFRPWIAALWLAWAGCGEWAELRANPAGPAVIRGSISIDNLSPGHLRVQQGSDRAVIDWRSFSIAPGEVTQFLQPGAASATLNRVRGSETSLLDGSLLATGSVYLLNPNGVIVGKNGRIDAGGFVASSLDLDPDEFLRGGDLQFHGSSQAPVINLGQIQASAGDVFLIAPQVVNEGTIRAPQGTVGLAAGNDVLLKEGGEERVFVRGASGSRKDVGVDQRGAIEANRAELKAHGGNLYALAIRNEGRVAATGVSRQGGQIYLSANGGKIKSSGSLRARSTGGAGGRVKIGAGRGGESRVELDGKVDVSAEVGRGGRVEVTGEAVELGREASLEANGPDGGGEIFVGGGPGGRDPEIANAEAVEVRAGAQLWADAAGRGNGGRIVVFANGFLGFEGQLSVRGGAGQGDGGFAELSGKEAVRIPDLGAQVDLGAPRGRAGTLLLDPVNLHVVDGAGGLVLGTTIGDGAIIDFLTNTGNLILDSGTLGPDDGDIFIDPGVDISWNSGNSLQFLAYRDFVMAGGTSIAANGSGSVTVAAGRRALLSGGIATASGDIDIQANQGPVAATGSFNGILLNGSLSTGTGSLFVKGKGGDGPGSHGVVLNGGISSTGTGAGAGMLRIEGVSRSGDDLGTGLQIGGSVSVVDADLQLTGNSLLGTGVHVASGLIESSGSGAGAGSILIQGESGGTTGNAYGVRVGGLGDIQTVAGDVVVTGDVNDGQAGLRLEAGSQFSSTGSGAYAGDFSFSGINAGGDGVSASGFSAGALDGSITFSGAGTTTDLHLAGASSIGGAGMAGDITLSGDTLDLSPAVSIQSSGNLTVAPRTMSTSIGIGTGAAGTLHLNDGELATFQDGFNSITIGHAASGAGLVTVQGAAFADPVTIAAPAAGGAISVAGPITNTGGGIVLDTTGNSTTLLANLVTGGAPIAILDGVVLGAGVTLDTTQGGAVPGGASVTVAGPVDADLAANLRTFAVKGGTGGTIEILGAIGGVQPLNQIKLSGASVTLGSTVAGQGDVEFEADELSLGGAVSGPGQLKMGPRTAGTSIGIGDGAAGTLHLSTVELGYLQDGFGEIVVGGPGSGVMHVAAAAFGDPLKLHSGSNLYVDGQLRGEDDASLTLETPLAQATYLQAPVVTDGNAVSILGRVVLGTDGLIDTTGGEAESGADVSITGEVLGTGLVPKDLEVLAGSAGAVDIGGAVGADERIGKIKLSGASVTLGSTVAGQGDVEFEADELSLGGAVSGPGQLKMGPRTAGTSIGIGDGAAGTLHLSTVELGYLQDGFGEIVVGGGAALPGAVEIRGGLFRDDLTIHGDSVGVTNLNASNQRVTLLAAGGNLSDLGDSALDIRADRVRLEAAGNIGASGDAIRLSHGAVVAARAGGGIFLEGAGDLTVGLADGLAGLESSSGDLGIAVPFRLRIAQPVISNGDQLFRGTEIESWSLLSTSGGRATLWLNDGGESESGLADVRADVQARDGLFLRGGEGDDLFQFSLLPASFPQPEVLCPSDGAGYDVLDFSGVTAGTPLHFNLAANPGLANGIERVVGTQDGRDRVSLPSLGSGMNVVVTGVDQFELTDEGKSFASFENLVGTGAADLITLRVGGRLSGGIDGSGGDDVIWGTPQADVFEILADNAGTVRGSAFASIERLLGGPGDDRFNFRNQATLSRGVHGQGNLRQDAMLIDDSNLMAGQTYVIGNGVVSRNPVYLFGGIESLTLLAGQGDDDITTNFQSYAQQIAGGPGNDTLHVEDAVSTVSALRLPGFGDIRFAGIETVDAGAVPDVDDLVGRTGQGGEGGNDGGQVTDQFSGGGGPGGMSLLTGPGGLAGGAGGLGALLPGALAGGDFLQAAFTGVNALVSRSFGIVSFSGGPPPSPEIRNAILNNVRNSAQSELSAATAMGGTIAVDSSEGIAAMSSGAADAPGALGSTSLEFSVSFGALAELGAALGLTGQTGVGQVEGLISLAPGGPAPGAGLQGAIAGNLSPGSLTLLSLAIGGDGTVTLDAADGVLATNVVVELPGAAGMLSLQGNGSLGALMELVRAFGTSGEMMLNGESGPVTLDVSGIPPTAQLRITLQVSNGVLAQYELGSALGMSGGQTAGPADGAFAMGDGGGVTAGQSGSLENQLAPDARNELEASLWQR